jgi:DNA-binding SARP family transcriptional activator
MPLELYLLGGFECRSGTGDVLTFPTSKVRALLAYLATNPDQGHRRDKLAELLWGDETADEGRVNLRKALSRLRQSLPGDARDCLAVDRDQLAVRPGGLEADVTLFLRLAAAGTPETMERAADLHRGALLEGFADCGEAFEEWLLGERRRLDETLHEILRRLLDHYVVTGAIDRAIQVALRLIALDALQESVHRALIRLYMYQDRVGAALDQYRRCRDVLERELGVPPSGCGPSCRSCCRSGKPGRTRYRARPTTCPSARRCWAARRGSAAGAGPSSRAGRRSRCCASPAPTPPAAAISVLAWRRTSRPSSAGFASST